MVRCIMRLVIRNSIKWKWGRFLYKYILVIKECDIVRHL
nr:MAG TPA: ApaLI-like restriction endonuclease [Caudoviricetes sp.]